MQTWLLYYAININLFESDQYLRNPLEYVRFTLH